jgi:hypothetical protein
VVQCIQGRLYVSIAALLKGCVPPAGRLECLPATAVKHRCLKACQAPSAAHLQYASANGLDVARQHGGSDVLQLAVGGEPQGSHPAGQQRAERGRHLSCNAWHASAARLAVCPCMQRSHSPRQHHAQSCGGQYPGLHIQAAT